MDNVPKYDYRWELETSYRLVPPDIYWKSHEGVFRWIIQYSSIDRIVFSEDHIEIVTASRYYIRTKTTKESVRFWMTYVPV